MEVHWIIVLATLLPMWFLQNIIHELSHGIALSVGWKWKFKIFPFPSKRLGYFTFAHVTYTATKGSLVPSNAGRGLTSGMPKLINMMFLTFATLLAMLLKNYLIASLLLMQFAVMNFVDYSYGMLAVFKSKPSKADLWHVQKYLGIPTKYLRTFAIFSIIYFAFVLSAGFVAIFV